MKQKGLTNNSKWLAKALNDYCSECLILFCAMLLVRIAETIALFATGYHAELIGNNLIGFTIDIANIGWIVGLLFLIYLIINKFSQKAATYTIRTFFAAYLCISIILMCYFISTHIPLDGIITAYSPRELFATLKANSPYNIPTIIIIIIISILYIAIPRKPFRVPKWAQITIFVAFIVSAFYPGLTKGKVGPDKKYYVIENKTRYLYESLKNKETVIQFTDSELKEKSEKFASYFPEYEFVDYHYPFLHKENTEDVLSNYFGKSECKPNIVIIIVEGLCNYISGKNSTIASATPFLDSLSEHSLVWENCLSTSERTFGALPSILGALPFGENGFMSYRRNVPTFNTIATILHDNGYKNTFFYGGWYGFDNMDIFAESNLMEMYYDKPEYESAEQRNEWGLLDEYTLLHSLEDIKTSDTTPRLDIYLTLTTHDPFKYPNQDEYIKKYNALPQKGKSISKTKENASFLYADDCLRKFFCEYKKSKTFSNTIFIITGDHKFNTKDKSNLIDNYHVPLIIWSPMLREKHSFPAVVTHRSITPSLL
ncbi:MAG: LTA synthase family protein, partial [Bacteroidales bacterium]|nr:LTA synthase family protein [Bacteroidales bacterium]